MACAHKKARKCGLFCFRNLMAGFDLFEPGGAFQGRILTLPKVPACVGNTPSDRLAATHDP